MRFMTLTAAALFATTAMATAAPLGSVDRNDDGMISFSEWKFTFGSDESFIGFNYSDRNGDGMLDLAEFNRATDTGVLSD